MYYSIIQKALPPEDIPDDQSSVSEDSPPTLSNGVNNSHVNKSLHKTAISATPKQNQRSQNSNSGKHRNSNNVKSSHELKSLSNHKGPENPPSGLVATNGDIGRPVSTGKVHLPSGKKQATVKAVPREDQPTTSLPVQDKVCIWVQ